LHSPTDILLEKAMANERTLERDLEAIVSRVFQAPLTNGSARIVAFNGRALRVWPTLSADTFRHAADKAAFEALRRIPLLDKAVAKFMEHGLERMLYLQNLADNVRVTASMFSRLSPFATRRL